MLALAAILDAVSAFAAVGELFKKKNVPTDGMKAAREGFDMKDNPFRNHSADHSIWRDDWLFEKGRFR